MILDLSVRLKELRLEKRLWQDQLAALAGLEKSSISMYENDMRQPSYETLVRFANVFNVSTDSLLGRRNAPYSISNTVVGQYRLYRPPLPVGGSRTGQTLPLMQVSVVDNWSSLLITCWPCIGDIKKDSRREIGGCPNGLPHMFTILTFILWPGVKSCVSKIRQSQEEMR